MARKGTIPPAAGMGRKKGSKNKTPIGVKLAIETVFDKIGGTKRFAEWAEKEPGEFYKIYSKLVPRDLTVSGGETPLVIKWLTRD